MKRRVMLILIGQRKESAQKVQKILSGWGCYIRTRLGLHDDVLDNCTESGLIFLQLRGEVTKLEEMERKLNLIDGVDAQMVVLNAE